MNVENRIYLDKFKLRPYQEPIYDAIFTKKIKKILWVSPRRAGKDITCWNIAIRQCVEKPCLVVYCLPTFGQAKRVIFDAIAIDGTKFLDYIDPRLVESINQSELKIRFNNGSILMLVGMESYNTSLIGLNFQGIVFSEFALVQNQAEIYSYIRPILAASSGWIIINSTPRGRNGFYHLFETAKTLPDWLVVHQKASIINHLPEDVLEKERFELEEGLYLQEYECDFSRGQQGAFYGALIDKMRIENRICYVPWEPQLLVNLAIDIGVNDATTIIWFQVLDGSNVIRIIDCYSKSGEGIDHFAKVIKSKPYVYNRMYAPFDIKTREWGSPGAVTRLEKARELDLNFIVLDQLSVRDGIENVMSHFTKFYIDKEKCAPLISALEAYRREWDDQRQMYDVKPVRNWATHFADALRYLCQGLYLLKSKSLSAEEYDRKKYEALYGSNPLPGIFNYDPRYDRKR